MPDASQDAIGLYDLLIIEGDQVGQEGPAFHKSILAGPDRLVVRYIPRDGTQ